MGLTNPGIVMCLDVTTCEFSDVAGGAATSVEPQTRAAQHLPPAQSTHLDQAVVCTYTFRLNYDPELLLAHLHVPVERESSHTLEEY